MNRHPTILVIEHRHKLEPSGESFEVVPQRPHPDVTALWVISRRPATSTWRTSDVHSFDHFCTELTV